MLDGGWGLLYLEHCRSLRNTSVRIRTTNNSSITTSVHQRIIAARVGSACAQCSQVFVWHACMHDVPRTVEVEVEPLLAPPVPGTC